MPRDKTMTDKDGGLTMAGGVAALHACLTAQVFPGACHPLSNFRLVLDSERWGTGLATSYVSLRVH